MDFEDKDLEKLLNQLQKMSIEEKILFFRNLFDLVEDKTFQEYILSFGIKNYSETIVELKRVLASEFLMVKFLEELDISELTFQLELLGKITNDDSRNSILLFFLHKYPNDVVKEGAILGLSHHMNNEIVYHRMKEALNNEFLSPLIKEIISEQVKVEEQIGNSK